MLGSVYIHETKAGVFFNYPSFVKWPTGSDVDICFLFYYIFFFLKKSNCILSFQTLDFQLDVMQHCSKHKQ